MRTRIALALAMAAVCLVDALPPTASATTFICPLVHGGRRYVSALTRDDSLGFGPPDWNRCPSPAPTGRPEKDWPVHEFRGFRPEFRLIVRKPHGPSTYEVWPDRNMTPADLWYTPSDGSLNGPIAVPGLRRLMDEAFAAVGVRFSDCSQSR